MFPVTSSTVISVTEPSTFSTLSFSSFFSSSGSGVGVGFAAPLPGPGVWPGLPVPGPGVGSGLLGSGSGLLGSGSGLPGSGPGAGSVVFTVELNVFSTCIYAELLLGLYVNSTLSPIYISVIVKVVFPFTNSFS